MIRFRDKLKNIKRRLQLEKALKDQRIQGEKPILNLYTADEIKADRSKASVKIVPFFIGRGAPTVVICPGGAYEFISFINEGLDFANAFNENGYNAVILDYRVSKNARYPNPMEDLVKTIAYLKNNSEKFRLDPKRFFLCGASAGGHLAAYFSARYMEFAPLVSGMDLRPEAVILAYPVISMAEDTHEHSRNRLLGPNSARLQQESMSVELIADENYPPVFFWHCEDDTSVPISNSIRFDERLSKVGVKHRFHRYPEGGHGKGLAKGTSAEGWFAQAIEFINSISE